MEIFDLQSILGFSAIVAVFAAIGGFIAEIAKSYLTSVVFAKWQEKQEAAKLFKKYKNPLALATIELANRLVEINKNYPASFLSRSSLKTKNVLLSVIQIRMITTENTN